MPRSLTLARVWRIIKEVDLEAVRREIGRPVHVLVVAETTADADDVSVRLAEGQPDPTPWLTSIDATLAARGRAAAQGRHEPPAGGPDVVVIAGRGSDLSDDLAASRRHWLQRGTRVVTVAVGGGEPARLVQTHPNAVRVAIPTFDGEGFADLAEAIIDVAAPDRRLALARRLPALRERAFDALIEETARANAGYAFSTALAEVIPLLDLPLNVGDVIVLTKNQLMMAYKIAVASGKPGTARQLIAEIVGVLGGGLLFRQVARELAGLVPVIGLVPKVAVAYGGTWAIGKVVAHWATGGEHAARSRMKRLSREGMALGRQVARTMKKGYPLD